MFKSKSLQKRHSLLQSIVPRNSILQKKKDLSQLSTALQMKNKSEDIYTAIDEYFIRQKIKFMMEIRVSLNIEQYYDFIDHLSLCTFQENTKIVQRLKPSQFYYVLIEGKVSYNQQKQIPPGLQQIQYIELFKPQIGLFLNPESQNAPKFTPYTILANSQAILLKFSVQTFNKYVKKYQTDILDECSFGLLHSSLFRGVGINGVKKCWPYFFHIEYKYNQFIYKQNDMAEYVYFITEGEVDIIKQEDSQNMCKIVKLSKHQVFGLDQHINKSECKYLFGAKVSSQKIKLVCINLKSLILIQNYYPIVNQNIDFYIKRTAKMHSQLLQTNMKIIQNKENLDVLIKKKKKIKNKKKKKNPPSLEWWGLAQKSITNKKYKVIMPPILKQISQSKSMPMFQNISLSGKIQDFKKKIFESEINQLQKNEKEQITEESPWKFNYQPKLQKLKVKMIDVKPKAIDTSQKVKKKLLSYAKNVTSFCDRLNLD